MKITCPKCAFVIDAGDVPDTLLPAIGDGILSVRCPKCATEIELTAVTATVSYAGTSSTWRGTVTSEAPKRCLSRVESTSADETLKDGFDLVVDRPGPVPELRPDAALDLPDEIERRDDLRPRIAPNGPARAGPRDDLWGATKNDASDRTFPLI